MTERLNRTELNLECGGGRSLDREESKEKGVGGGDLHGMVRLNFQFSSVQSLSRVRLFATP